MGNDDEEVTHRILELQAENLAFSTEIRSLQRRLAEVRSRRQRSSCSSTASTAGVTSNNGVVGESDVPQSELIHEPIDEPQQERPGQVVEGSPDLGITLSPGKNGGASTDAGSVLAGGQLPASGLAAPDRTCKHAEPTDMDATIDLQVHDAPSNLPTHMQSQSKAATPISPSDVGASSGVGLSSELASADGGTRTSDAATSPRLQPLHNESEARSEEGWQPGSKTSVARDSEPPLPGSSSVVDIMGNGASAAVTTSANLAPDAQSDINHLQNENNRLTEQLVEASLESAQNFESFSNDRNALWSLAQELRQRVQNEQTERQRCSALLASTNEALEKLAAENLQLAENLMQCRSGDRNSELSNPPWPSKTIDALWNVHQRETGKLRADLEQKTCQCEQMQALIRQQTTRANATILEMARRNLELEEKLRDACRCLEEHGLPCPVLNKSSTATGLSAAAMESQSRKSANQAHEADDAQSFHFTRHLVPSSRLEHIGPELRHQRSASMPTMRATTSPRVHREAEFFDDGAGQGESAPSATARAATAASAATSTATASAAAVAAAAAAQSEIHARPNWRARMSGSLMSSVEAFDNIQAPTWHTSGIDSPRRSTVSRRTSSPSGAVHVPVGGGLQTPPSSGYGTRIKSEKSPARWTANSSGAVPELPQFTGERMTSFPADNHEVNDVCEIQSPQLEAAAWQSTRMHTGQLHLVHDETVRGSNRDNSMLRQGEVVESMKTPAWQMPALNISADTSAGAQGDQRGSPRSPFLGMDGRYTGRGVKPGIANRRSGSAPRRSDQLQRNLDVMSLEMRRIQQRALLAAE